MLADPEVTSLDLAWSVGRMKRFFAERVVPAVWPGREFRKLKRRYIAYKPGQHCMISCVLWLEDPASSDPEFVTLTLGPLTKLERDLTGSGTARRTLPAPGGAFLLTDVPCLVEVFPADWEIPALAEAMALTELDPGPSGASRPAPVRAVRILRYRAHRSGVLRYELETGGGGCDRQGVRGHLGGRSGSQQTGVARAASAGRVGSQYRDLSACRVPRGS